MLPDMGIHMERTAATAWEAHGGVAVEETSLCVSTSATSTMQEAGQRTLQFAKLKSDTNDWSKMQATS